MKPTKAAYDELQRAYDYFNRELFDSNLPECLITLQRDRRSYGYFVRSRFIEAGGETTDEIAMNPAFFAVCPPEEIMQTLVHEMIHLWQFHFGKPGRRGYHNVEWGQKMESLGLMPSSTGEPGGKKTGESVADYIIEGGLFEEKCQDLFTQDFKITWMDRHPVKLPGVDMPSFITDSIEHESSGEGGDGVAGETSENKTNRWKYQCLNCKINVWGKPNLNIVCGVCKEEFIGE